jgi:hypothetical protein
MFDVIYGFKNFSSIVRHSPENQEVFFISSKGENPSSIECPPGKCALAPHIPFERVHQIHQE